jgi:hypothetical protein
MLPIFAFLSVMLAVFYIFVTRFLYLRFVKKVKPKYPLVPPGSGQGPYFPRTNIPRPIYKDFREHPAYFDKKKKVGKGA